MMCERRNKVNGYSTNLPQNMESHTDVAAVMKNLER